VESATPAPAPSKGDAGKKGADKRGPVKVEAAPLRSQRIDLRFDMVVPGTERPGQAEGLILRPTAK
jgi:chemotaxis protein MotB